MSKNNFGIKSTFDAFVALNEILEEEKPSLKKKLKNKNLREGVSVDLRSNDELEAAKKIRAEKKDDTTLEVIDVDADAVDQIQNNDSYVGKMLLQCVSCKATRFMDIDDLKQDENDKDLYNLEDECPHCHHKGSGYSLVGQVGKTPDQEEEEATVDNDEASTEEAVFDNTEDVENEEAEEETPEETPTEEKPEEDEEEKDFTETDSEDDTSDLDLADLGDEFNVDDIVSDDTETEDEEDKTKKESLKEDLFTMTPEYIFKVGDTFTTPIDFEDDAFVADTVYTIVDLGNGKYGIEYENLNYPYVSGGSDIVDIFEEDSLEELSRQIFDYDPHISMEMINRFDPYASYHYGENNEEDEKAMASEFDHYKSMKENLNEDSNNGFYKVEYHRILPSNIFKNSNQEDYLYVFAEDANYAKQYVASHINQAMIDKVEEVKFSDIPDYEKIADSIAWWDSNSIHYLYEDADKDLKENWEPNYDNEYTFYVYDAWGGREQDLYSIKEVKQWIKHLEKTGNKAVAIGVVNDDISEEFDTLEELIDYLKEYEEKDDFNESLSEKLDMATFEGSIANLIDTFTIEDRPVNVKLLNKNGSELGIYSSDDLPFTIKSQMMDTFNTDDNFLELNVTEEGEGTTVNDLFNYYRPDEDNQTTFLVTDIDTEEEAEYEELSELLENYGDYYIDGALGLRTLNIYIADGDLETKVEPLDDEEIEELGKENAEKENVTDESLIEEIIKSYPRLKLSRVNNPLSEEYFIAESIRLNEDLDLVYNTFVKHSNDKKLIEHFKSYTGYEDEVDKFLKEHNISKAKYNKIINEGYDIDDYLEDLAADSCKENNIIDNYDDFKAICSQEGFDDISKADFGVYQKLCKKCKKANMNESADKTYTINGTDYILYKDSYGNYKLDDKKTRERVADWDSYDEAMADIKKWIKANKITDATDEINEDAKTGKFIYDDISKFDIELPVEPCKVVLVNQGAYDLEQKGKSGHFTWVTYVHPGKYGKSQKKMNPIIEDVANQIADMYKEKYGKEAIVEDHIDSLDMFRVYVEDDKEDVKEKLFASVKNRAQLGEAINKLVKANEKYRISKSVTEGYRYDIFVSKNCKLNEAVNDDLVRKVVADANDEYNRYKNETNEPLEYFIGQSADSFGVPFDKWHVFLPDHISEEDEEFKAFKRGYEDNHGPLDEGLFDLASSNDSNVDEIDAEVVDRETPEATTTQLVPEGMSEEDIEIVNKIDRIAGDICDAIEEVYNIPAREKKPYVAADIIRDLQLVGGEVLADDLEDTPWDNLTREMYNQFNGFYDSLDDLVSFITGQRVTTSQAERLRQAIASLDGPHFTTEAIRANIASPRFLEAVRRGYVPYVSPQEISTNGNNRNNRNRFLEQCDDEITEDVNPKLVDMDGDVEDLNFNLASFAKTTVTESAKDFQEFGNAEDVEKRLDELEYLKTQRDLNDEEQEEYEYCLQLLGKEYEEEEYPIDLEEFDSGINEYFADSDDVLGYTSKKIRKDGNDFIVEGLVENWDTSKPVTFIIKKNEGKDNYTVSNDLFEDKFTLDL